MADESKGNERPDLTAGGVPERLSFPGTEEAVLALWKHLDAFKTQLRLTKGNPEYNFYDGPPFATGLPHYGHILAGTIKDVVTRYKSMEGFYVSRRFGWDCHGLPVEYEIDKKLGIKSTDDVEAMGIRKYNEECRSIVTRYCAQWETIVTRLGRWIDFKNDYKTMEPWYMESVWWVFKTVFDKDLVYRGFKIMPYSTACNTPLSNFEAGQNYKEDTVDPAVIVSFPILNREEHADTSFVAWTTTPWTLPSNLALCVNPAHTYVKVADKTRGKKFIMMEACLTILFPKKKKKNAEPDFEILQRFTGADLMGWEYKPLFPYFAQHPGAFRVLGDDYVTDSAGTGVVHQAPAFGEDDYRVCMAAGVVVKGGELPCPVDANGRFTGVVTDFAGTYVKAADDAICAMLKTNGRLVKKGSVVHSYPFCWRSDTPLIYRAVPSWFVNVTAIKDQLLANNEQTYWVPEFVKSKRFHNWLKDARDWAVSRTRYWGTPIPLWVSDDGEEVVCIGSIEELEQRSGVRATDLHRENIDHITIPSSMGKGTLKRVPEVFDCWFESGSMPYAQVHYPFENKEKFDAHFPADFIAEGLDQTRGWFYTLMVLSTALKNKPAFKNLIVNGLVLAQDGKKMSKRLKNYPPPTNVIDAYGADALRLYLINSPVVRAEPLRFQEAGVHDVIKDVFLPWFNAFRFFVMNAARSQRSTGVKFVPDASVVYASTNEMDQWLMAALQGLIRDVRAEMDAYRLYNVAPPLVSFVQQLTNWYVRLNRSRLKGQDGEEAASVALNGMYEVLLAMCRLMAPLTPFFTEYMYQFLRTYHPDFSNADAAENAVGRAESVHYLSIPEFDASKINQGHVDRVNTMQTVVELGRQIRDRATLSIKQPVREVMVVQNNAEVLAHVDGLQGYISAELNTLTVTTSLDEASWVDVKAEANARTLARRLGKKFPPVRSAIAALTCEEVAAFAAAGEDATMEVGGVTVTAEDVNVVRTFKGDSAKYVAAVSRDGSLTVIMNIVQDDELRAMHTARETVNRVQKLRKSAGLAFTDVVDVYLSVSEAQPPVLESVPAPVLAETKLDLPAAALKPKPKPSAGAGGAGAGAGAAEGSSAGGKQQGKKGGKQQGKKGGKQQGKKGGKQQGKKGGKQQGKKGGKQGGKGKAAPAAAAAPTGPTGPEAVATVKAALSAQGATIVAAVPSGVAPDTVRPSHAVVIAQERTNVNGADMTVTLTRPSVLFADDAAFPSECKGKETLFKQVLADRDLNGLKAEAAANGGAVTVEVCGATATLRLNTHFFFTHATQFAGDAAARAAWAAAGVEGLGAALVAATTEAAN